MAYTKLPNVHAGGGSPGGSNGFGPVGISRVISKEKMSGASVRALSRDFSYEGAVPLPGSVTWMGTSWLLLTDVVGTSVLTFAGVARQLGWVLTAVFLIGLCPVSIYVAILMSRTRSKLAQQGVAPSSMGEAAALTLGNNTSTSYKAGAAVHFLVYGFAFLGNGAYLLTMGNALQGVFYNTVLCLPSAVLAACLCCLPVILLVRNLSDSVALCLANLFLIIAVLVIVMVKMWEVGVQENSQTYYVAEDLSLLTLFGAMTNIVYSYAGQWLYFEMMHEMELPEDFPKVFYINAPLQVGLYLLVAFWGYYYAGDQAKGYFLDNLPASAAYSWASGILFVHVAIAYLIKNVIVARSLHRLVSPSRVDVRVGDPSGEGLRAHLEYSLCAIVALAGNGLLALSIPFFSDLLGLLGGLLSGPISYLLPMVFFIGACRREQQSMVMDSEEADNVETVSHHAQGPPGCGNCRRIRTMLKEACLSRVDLVICTMIATFILMTMFIGTSGVMRDIAEKANDDAPFSCKPLKLEE